MLLCEDFKGAVIFEDTSKQNEANIDGRFNDADEKYRDPPKIQIEL